MATEPPSRPHDPIDRREVDSAFFRAVAELRADVRDDNKRLEDRVMAAIADARREQRESVEAHAKAHLATARDNETDLGRIREFMRDQELAAARRDGALGVFRFVVEQVSRHWQPLAALLGTAAGLVAFLTGSIHIVIGLS